MSSAAVMFSRRFSFWLFKVWADIRACSLERGRQIRISCSKWAFYHFLRISSTSRELWPCGIAIAIRPIATGVTVAWSVCPSVTLVHSAKTAGRKEMPFARDSRVVSGKGRFGGSEPSQNLHCILQQIAAKPLQVAELLPLTAYSNSATPYPMVP